MPAKTGERASTCRLRSNDGSESRSHDLAADANTVLFMFVGDAASKDTSGHVTSVDISSTGYRDRLQRRASNFSKKLLCNVVAPVESVAFDPSGKDQLPSRPSSVLATLLIRRMLPPASMNSDR